jgi:hypothetical protein
MSEAEKKRRADYKRNRQKWILIQAVIISLVSVLLLGTAFTYYQINKTYYIDYTESSNVDYSVQLAPNNFYEEEWIEKDKAYVSSLIENIMAKFNYELDMKATAGVEYSYSYYIDATLRITDKYSGAVIYEPVTEIVPLQSHKQNGAQKLVIKETVLVDYDEYNDKAISFNDTYKLKDSSCMLVLTLHINVTGSCDEFEQNSENTYFTSLNFPLAVDTAEPVVTSSTGNGESKVLACASAMNKDIFLAGSILFGVLDVILVAILIGFVHITKNEDINYNIKVQKIFKNYRSYIQKITNVFETDNYQVLAVSTFNELLSIRDTIQSPILMCENEDQTKTGFMIPTNTNLLYVYEIKVDNYDDIYANAEDSTEELVLVEEDVDSEALLEAMAEPTVELESIDYVEDDDQDYEGTEEAPGVEVVGVVWPEKPSKNKVYRYDPNGAELHNGDIVLVPTTDVEQEREVIRKAAVAHENHKVAPDTLNHPLKKVIGIVKRKVEDALSGSSEDIEK